MRAGTMGPGASVAPSRSTVPASGPLSRAIEVEVDRASWRSQPAAFRHPFPRALARQAGPLSIHLLLMLQRLGELPSGTARLISIARAQCVRRGGTS